MNENIIIRISFALILFLLIVVIATYWYWKKREKRLHISIQNMIEDAIAGTFTESRLEESKISELESSMWRFLNDCQVSSLQMKEQKQQIQSLISDISHQTITPISNIKIYTELLEEQQRIIKSRKNIGNESISEERLGNLEEERLGDLEEDILGDMDKDIQRVKVKEVLGDINGNILEDMEEELNVIKDQVEKLDFLIESLVKLSRLENGILSMNPQKACISDILSTLKTQFTKKAQSKNISLVIEDSKEEAIFDDKWTVEAVANIVDNAIKYTPVGGQVLVQVYAYSLFLRLDVIDTGIGIAEQERGSIFTRFYRSPAVRTQSGVGIGLYLAREVLRKQNGYIKVSSKVGIGSTFSVFLYRG